MEPITEQLMTRIGEVYGFRMAESKLAWLGGQIRFLSKYFITLKNNEILEHGADLYSGFLRDKDFVEEVEIKNLATSFFTVEFTKEVLEYFYKNNHNEIYQDFINMLIFDALVGNNDRHFYNWGIIKNISGKKKSFFSPIYDSARGLFWNLHENKILEIIKDNNIDNYIKKYCNNCKPKIGIEGNSKINHFYLIKTLFDNNLIVKNETTQCIFTNNKIDDVIKMINFEFKFVISEERLFLINKCLKFRFNVIKSILT